VPEPSDVSDIGEGGDGVLITLSSEIEEPDELRSPSAMACCTQACATSNVVVSIWLSNS